MTRSVAKVAAAKQSKREFAYLDGLAQQCYSQRKFSTKVNSVEWLSSNCCFANSLYRYPSPNRPAYSPSRPITVFRLSGRKIIRDIGYHAGIAIHQGAVRANCGAAYITTIGSRLCKRHQSSLQQWQYLVWQVALRATWSVAWPVQVQALWPQKCWAQIAQVQSLPVQPQAYFATMQVSTAAVKVDARAHHGRVISVNRRRGSALAAFLRLGDRY